MGSLYPATKCSVIYYHLLIYEVSDEVSKLQKGDVKSGHSN